VVNFGKPETSAHRIPSLSECSARTVKVKADFAALKPTLCAITFICCLVNLVPMHFTVFNNCQYKIASCTCLTWSLHECHNRCLYLHLSEIVPMENVVGCYEVSHAFWQKTGKLISTFFLCAIFLMFMASALVILFYLSTLRRQMK